MVRSPVNLGLAQYSFVCAIRSQAKESARFTTCARRASTFQEKEKEKARASAKGIILGTDWADMNVSMGMADYVRRACHSELTRIVRGLEIRNTGNMSRSDAIKMAKDEDRFYVVAIEFQTFGSQYEVRYTIYEPKTAKPIGLGSAPIFADNTGRISYWSFERAGRDIAQQLVRRLDLRSTRFP
jgi:hypothetical protein